VLTSVMSAVLNLIFPHNVQGFDLPNDLLVEREDIPRFDIRRFILLQQQQRIAGAEKPFQYRLLPRIERNGDGWGFHDGIRG
jgi:hypothetical protein